MADQLSWIGPTGVEQQFFGDKIRQINGMNGRFMPSIEFVEDEVPFQAGSMLRNVKVKARDVDVPLYIKASSETELRTLVRGLLKSFNPMRGDGKLRSITPDGSGRELVCRYKGGLEGAESRDVKGTYWQKLILVFHAFDPYWYDTSTIVQTFTIGQTATFFPFFPLTLSSSTVFADVSIDNDGDVETYPEWIITGPGQNINIKNNTTGETINLQTSLGIGESITIETKPLLRTVTKNDGTNLYYTLLPDSTLWALQQGSNSIQLEMDNATSDSNIQLTYQNRYLGA